MTDTSKISDQDHAILNNALEVVEAYMGVPQKYQIDPGKNKNAILARAIAISIMIRLGVQHDMIAVLLGKTRSTVSRGAAMAEQHLKENPEMRSWFDAAWKSVGEVSRVGER